jgi:hypothetical protein
LLLDVPLASGEVYGHDGEPCRRVWTAARAPALAARVLEESLRFLAARDTPAKPTSAPVSQPGDRS